LQESIEGLRDGHIATDISSAPLGVPSVPPATYVALEGAAPKRVAITEWDNLEQAEAFYKSKAWNDLAPQRDKALKTIRRYAVEAVN
jgi:hypothetical protein